MVDYLKKELNMSFEDAVAHVEKIIQEEGFSHMLTKSIDQIFKKKLEIDYDYKITIILACGPEFAKGALDVTWKMGMLFPCSFAVYEKDGMVFVAHISIMKIGKELFTDVSDKMGPVIKMTGEAVHRAWNRF